MPKNLEIKVKLDSFSEIEKKLKLIEAKYFRIIVQQDNYFKSPKGILKLRLEESKKELILYNRNESSEKRWSDYKIWEIEDDAQIEMLKDILETEVIVEKKRKLFIYENTRIHLDEVESIGKFLELESVVVDNDESAQREYYFVYDSLGLSDYEELRCSYRDLILKNKNI